MLAYFGSRKNGCLVKIGSRTVSKTGRSGSKKTTPPAGKERWEEPASVPVMLFDFVYFA
jgi:hypothetical protein